MQKKNTSNNEFGIDNHFYDTQIRDYLKKLKGSQTSYNYLKSSEYNDLQLVLNQFAKSKVNVMFVIPPVIKNGWILQDWMKICTNKRYRRFAIS